jgi:hypothetical protein
LFGVAIEFSVLASGETIDTIDIHVYIHVYAQFTSQLLSLMSHSFRTGAFLQSGSRLKGTPRVPPAEDHGESSLAICDRAGFSMRIRYITR